MTRLTRLEIGYLTASIMLSGLTILADTFGEPIWRMLLVWWLGTPIGMVLARRMADDAEA